MQSSALVFLRVYELSFCVFEFGPINRNTYYFFQPRAYIRLLFSIGDLKNIFLIKKLHIFLIKNLLALPCKNYENKVFYQKYVYKKQIELLLTGDFFLGEGRRVRKYWERKKFVLFYWRLKILISLCFFARYYLIYASSIFEDRYLKFNINFLFWSWDFIVYCRLLFKYVFSFDNV